MYRRGENIFRKYFISPFAPSPALFARRCIVDDDSVKHLRLFESCDREIKADLSKARKLVDEGMRLANDGKMEKALKNFNGALRAYPLLAAYLYKGVALFMLSEKDESRNGAKLKREARKLFSDVVARAKRMAEASPYDVNAWYFLGDALFASAHVEAGFGTKLLICQEATDSYYQALLNGHARNLEYREHLLWAMKYYQKNFMVSAYIISEARKNGKKAVEHEYIETQKSITGEVERLICLFCFVANIDLGVGKV